MNKQTYTQPETIYVDIELDALMAASPEGFFLDDFEEDGTF